MGRKIVILGGGAGGPVAANKLRRALSRDNEIAPGAGIYPEKIRRRFFLKSGGCGTGFRR